MVRITTSWKAEVFADTDERERVRSATGALSLDEVVHRLGRDLGERPPAEPLEDEDWMTRLAAVYSTPTVRIPQEV